MWFFWSVFINILSNVGLALLTPKPKQQRQAPSALGEFVYPTAEEGRAIQLLRGTGRVRGANLLYMGGLRAIDSGIEHWLDDDLTLPTISGVYHYHLTMQLGFCHGPIDEVVQVLFDERPVTTPPIVITEGNNAMKAGLELFTGFLTPDDWPLVTIATGAYDSIVDVCKAWTDALVAGTGAAVAVNYGMHVQSGYRDQLEYQIHHTTHGYRTVPVYIPPANYTGAVVALADALQTALNDAEIASAADAGVDPAVSFRVYAPGHWPDSPFGAGNLRIDVTKLDPDVDKFRFNKLDGHITAYPMLGVKRGTGVSWGEIDPWTTDHHSVIADYIPSYSRFEFWAGDVFRIAWGLPESVSRDFFGATGFMAYPDEDYFQTVGDEPMTGADRLFPGPTGITDMGDYWAIDVDARDLFGGDTQEGGVRGQIRVYKGNRTQVADPYLEAQIGKTLPGYRTLCYAVLPGFYYGTSKYLKAMQLDLRCTPNPLGLTGGKENIAGDCNPASFLYEILTDRVWGLKVDPDDIDIDAFIAAAEQLYDEGLGLTFIQDSAIQAGELRDEIEKHIDAVTYDDPFTGKVTIRLIRADYDIDDLPVISPSNASNLRLAYPTWDSVSNVVKLRYVDRLEGYVERFAVEEDAAVTEARKGVRSTAEFSMRGFSNSVTARKGAARLLAALGRLATLECDVNRTLWQLRPGSPAKLVWPDYGIESMPVRIGRLRPGDPTDGAIHVDAAQDRFGVNWTTYTGPGAREGGDVVANLAASRLEETPYALAGGEDRRITTLGAPSGGGVTTGYDVWSDEDGGTDFVKTADDVVLTPTGLLAESIAVLATSMTFVDEGQMRGRLFTVSDGSFALGSNLLLLEDEWIAWQTITDNENGTFTVSGCARGVMDTTPRAHGSGSRAWFGTAGSGSVQEDAYPDDRTVAVRLVPFNGEGELPLASAPTIAKVLASRCLRPYVPTAILLNGEAYPESIEGTLTVSWSHRDRLGTWSYADSGATDDIETGCSVRIRFYSADGTLLHTASGITGTSYTWGSEATDSGGELNDAVRVVLDVLNADELESYQRFDHQVARTGSLTFVGYGTDYGALYG